MAIVQIRYAAPRRDLNVNSRQSAGRAELSCVRKIKRQRRMQICACRKDSSVDSKIGKPAIQLAATNAVENPDASTLAKQA